MPRTLSRAACRSRRGDSRPQVRVCQLRGIYLWLVGLVVGSSALGLGTRAATAAFWRCRFSDGDHTMIRPTFDKAGSRPGSPSSEILLVDLASRQQSSSSRGWLLASGQWGATEFLYNQRPHACWGDEANVRHGEVFKDLLRAVKA